MKKSLFPLLLLSVFSISGLKAQENVVKANILSPALYTGSASFEHVFNWSMSYDVGASFTPATDITNDFIGGKQEVSGYSATVGLRRYSKMNAPDGFYFGPYVRHQNITFKELSQNEVIEASVSVSSAGVKTGYQFVINESFIIDIFTGSGFGMYNFRGSGPLDDVTEVVGVGKVVTGAATYGFNVGYAF